MDSLVGFYNKYADVEKKATLVILGYADASGFKLFSYYGDEGLKASKKMISLRKKIVFHQHQLEILA